MIPISIGILLFRRYFHTTNPPRCEICHFRYNFHNNPYSKSFITSQSQITFPEQHRPRAPRQKRQNPPDAGPEPQTRRHRAGPPDREKATFQLDTRNKRTLGPPLRKSRQFQGPSALLHELRPALGLPHVHIPREKLPNPSTNLLINQTASSVFQSLGTS